jgi:hypothetical protein
MSTVSPAEILKAWVAPPGVPPTRLLRATCLDVDGDQPRRELLARWQPKAVHSTVFNLMHVAASDATGPYVQVTSLSATWPKELADLCGKLKLRLQPPIGGVEYLLDDQIRNEPQMPMDGWKVKRWVVQKGVSKDLLPVHQDLVTWEHSDAPQLEAVSIFMWRNYEP